MDVVALAQVGLRQRRGHAGHRLHRRARAEAVPLHRLGGLQLRRRRRRPPRRRPRAGGRLPHASDMRSVRFLFLPPEHDPDSYRARARRRGLRAARARAVPLSRQMVEQAARGLRPGHGRRPRAHAGPGQAAVDRPCPTARWAPAAGRAGRARPRSPADELAPLWRVGRRGRAAGRRRRRRGRRPAPTPRRRRAGHRQPPDRRRLDAAAASAWWEHAERATTTAALRACPARTATLFRWLDRADHRARRAQPLGGAARARSRARAPGRRRGAGPGATARTPAIEPLARGRCAALDWRQLARRRAPEASAQRQVAAARGRLDANRRRSTCALLTIAASAIIRFSRAAARVTAAPPGPGHPRTGSHQATFTRKGCTSDVHASLRRRSPRTGSPAR